MAACSLFEEDEVCVYKPGKGYSFGLVLENSEFLSSGEEDEADTLNERLSKGTVRVSWYPSGKETVVSEDKVQLLDRSLMPGDVVKRLIPGQDSQCGFVMDMDVHCHLRILRTDKYIYSVNSKDMELLQKFEYGQEVMMDSWLGRIECFDTQVILLFPDGARCQIDESDLCSFHDVMEKRSTSEFSECPFYPGQELKGPLNSLSDAKWLHSTSRFCHRTANRKGKSSTAVVKVEKIVYKSVEVHWLYRGFEKSDHATEALSPPPNVIEGDNVERLQILDWFRHCSVQIGDFMTYRIKNDDIITSIEPAKAYDPKTAVIKDATVKVLRDSDNKKQDEPVTNSVTSGTSIEKDTDDGDDADFEDVDDADKSGLHEKNGASGGGGRGTGSGHGGRKRSRVVKTLGQRQKTGKQVHSQKSNNKKRVLKECSFKSDEVVHVEVEFTTSWAAVMWQDGTVEKDIPSLELFPVHHLDGLEFFPGDFVLSTVDLPEPADYGVVVKADHAERTCLVHWMKTYEVGKATAPTVVASNCEVSVYDITDHPDYKFRPGQSIVRVGGFEHLTAEPGAPLQALGQVFEMDANGHLVVKWANGCISQCYPQELYIISEDMDDVSENSVDSWEGSEYETDGSGEIWETESENEIIGGDIDDKDCKDDGGFDQGALCEHKQKLDALLSRAEVALVRLQKLLNVFNISAVSVPECFHDIIRIYRSCHDLDNILQSSFFNDPELQSLISQAKKEIRRDKANKISKHLSQLFEAWSSSLPAEDGENVGTVAIGVKSIRVSAKRKAADIEVSLQVPTGEGDSCDSSHSQLKSGAAGGSEVSEDSNVSMLIHDSPAVSDLINACDALCELKGMKELSDAAVNDCCRSGTNERRSSDPSSISVSFAFKNKKKNKDANLVGENCVSKAAKRTKSDGFDDSGHEAKKSRDETITANHIAQDLCFKICESLQKQILKIHEEVNKRTRRLINVTVKHMVANENGVFEDVNLPASPLSNSSETVGCDHNEGSDVSDVLEHDDRGSVNKDTDPSLSVLSPPHSEVKDCAPAVNSSQEKPFQDEKPGLTESNAVIEEKSADHDNPLPAQEEGCEAMALNSCISQKDDISETLEHVKDLQDPCKGFSMYGEAQSFHTYISRESQPANPRAFKTAVRKELKLFQTSLPDGIFIKGFEDRLDLYSIMILGPAGTPYEDGLFIFDMMLPNDYPNAPPLCHYHSYCTDRLNPNLYEDGKVCVSLLGTWAGKGTEVWTSKSNLLQVLVSIQGLILVPEPYYNEAGYERQRGTQVGQENSRMYNEMAILKTVQSLTKMCQTLPTLFKEEIYQYITIHGPRMISRLRHWMSLNELQKNQSTDHGCNTAQTKETQPLPQASTLDVPQQETVEHSRNSGISPASDQPVLDGTRGSLADTSPPQSVNVTGHIQNGTYSIDTHRPDTGTGLRANGGVQDEQTGSAEPGVEPRDDPGVSNTESGHTDSLSQTLNGHSVALHSPVNGSLIVHEAAADLQKETMAAIQCSKDNNQKNRDKEISITFSDQGARDCQNSGRPEFTLFPMSRGFCLTLHKFLNMYEKALQIMEIRENGSSV